LYDKIGRKYSEEIDKIGLIGAGIDGLEIRSSISGPTLEARPKDA
jgi:hypothetical protein